MTNDNDTLRRRAFLTAAATSAAVALSGCARGDRRVETDTTTSTPTATPTETPEPTQETPAHDCAEAEWNAAATDTIEIAVHYGEGHGYAAEVMQSYAEYAVSHAFGDEYAVDAFVGSPVPYPHTLEGYADWIRETDERTASDANLLVADIGLRAGGGNTAIGGDPETIREIDAECVERSGHGESHFDVNLGLHEIGHCLGMSHKTAGRHGGYGGAPVVPMATSYIDSTPHIHEYHEDSISEADY